MSRMTKTLAGALFAVCGLAGSALASPGYTTQGVTLRAGPGGDYPSVSYLRPGTPTEIFGCLDGFEWCDVDADGERGWVRGSKLDVSYGGRRELLPYYAPRIGLPIVTFSFNDYWGRYYHNRPFYAERERFGRLPVFRGPVIRGPVIGGPIIRGPGFHPPGYDRPYHPEPGGPGPGPGPIGRPGFPGFRDNDDGNRGRFAEPGVRDREPGVPGFQRGGRDDDHSGRAPGLPNGQQHEPQHTTPSAPEPHNGGGGMNHPAPAPAPAPAPEPKHGGGGNGGGGGGHNGDKKHDQPGG